jgi:PQQ-dependent catabolism-associated CXXCW motif protein
MLLASIIVPARVQAADYIDLLNPGAAKVYDDEASDFGVKPIDRLQTAARIDSPTPLSIPGGKIITTGEVANLESGSAWIFDVFSGIAPYFPPVPDAYLWNYAATPGTFDDQAQANVGDMLGKMTKGDKGFPIIFYCAGPHCWLGYNAALRAIHAGYKNVYWYRGGAEAWRKYLAASAR